MRKSVSEHFKVLGSFRQRSGLPEAIAGSIHISSPRGKYTPRIPCLLRITGFFQIHLRLIKIAIFNAADAALRLAASSSG